MPACDTPQRIARRRAWPRNEWCFTFVIDPRVLYAALNACRTDRHARPLDPVDCAQGHGPHDIGTTIANCERDYDEGELAGEDTGRRAVASCACRPVVGALCRRPPGARRRDAHRQHHVEQRRDALWKSVRCRYVQSGAQSPRWRGAERVDDGLCRQRRPTPAVHVEVVRERFAMSIILAIEPDRRRATQLTAMARAHLRAELLVAPTAAQAIETLDGRVPD